MEFKIVPVKYAPDDISYSLYIWTNTRGWAWLDNFAEEYLAEEYARGYKARDDFAQEHTRYLEL